MRIAVPLAAVAAFMPGALGGMNLHDLLPTVPRITAAALLYGLAHCARALRLAALAAPALSLRYRTLVFLHFHAALVSFIVPFKIGELYRAGQLMAVSGSAAKPLVLLLIERVLDAVVLLGLFAALLIVGHEVPPHLQNIGFLMLAVIAATLFTLYVLQPVLEAVQAYIFNQHADASTPGVLRLIHSVRETVAVAKNSLRGNFAMLLALSALIWFGEGMTLLTLAPGYGEQVGAFLLSALSMALSSSPAASQANPVSHLYVLSALTPLVVVWPMATWLFIRQTMKGARRFAAEDAVPQELSSCTARRRYACRSYFRRKTPCPSR